MKKFLLGTAALVALGMAAPASAADLGARPYTKAPPMMAAVYDWTGFYIGANAGGARVRDENSFFGNAAFTAAGVFPATSAFITANQANNRRTGFTGGGQIGYNWQASNWVFGLEADAQYLDRRNEGFTGSGFPGIVATESYNRSDWFATFRPRVGILVTPTLLLYGTGGLAISERNRANVTITQAGATGNFSNGNNDIRTGWTAGAGAEWGFAPNWSAKVEYLHVEFDRNSTDAAFTGALAVGFPGTAAAMSNRTTLDIGRVGINYRWGGPVVARY